MSGEYHCRIDLFSIKAPRKRDAGTRGHPAGGLRPSSRAHGAYAYRRAVVIDDDLGSAGLRLVHFGFSPDSGSQQLLLLDGSYKAGWLNYDICAACRRGHVWKLTIDDKHQRLGVGSHMLSVARRREPGLRWTTSGHRPEARGFWSKIGARTGLGYQAEKPCACLKNQTKPWRQRFEIWRYKQVTGR